MVLWCTVVGRGEGVLHSLHNVLLCFVQVPLHCVLHCGVLVVRALVGRGEGVLPKYKHRSIVWAARTDPSEGQMATRPYQRKISLSQKNILWSTKVFLGKKNIVKLRYNLLDQQNCRAGLKISRETSYRQEIFDKHCHRW